jgi:hypothetical protein
MVASTSPLSAAEERELRGLQRRAARTLEADGAGDRVPQLDSPFLDLTGAQETLPGVAAADIDRMAALNRKVVAARTCRCSVVAFPAGAPEVEGVSG